MPHAEPHIDDPRRLCIILSPIPPCYQGKIEGLREFLISQGIRTVFSLPNPALLKMLPSEQIWGLISIHANTAIELMMKADFTVQYLIAMATYLPNTIANSLGRIHFPQPPDIMQLSKCVKKRAIFISEHDNEASNKKYFSHHMFDGLSAVLSIPWGLTAEEVSLSSHFRGMATSPSQLDQLSLKSFRRICHVGLLSEKLIPIFEVLRDLSSLIDVVCVGPDASLLSNRSISYSFRQLLIPSDRFMKYIASRSLLGELLLSIHHEFELEWSSTYNERCFKALSCGVPILTDNSAALLRRFDCTFTHLRSTTRGRQLAILIPNPLQDESGLAYSSFLPQLLCSALDLAHTPVIAS